MVLKEFIQKLPKVELHVHLEGTVTAEFWLSLIQNRSFLKRFAANQGSFHKTKGVGAKEYFRKLQSLCRYYRKHFFQFPFFSPYSLNHLAQRYQYRTFEDFLDTYGDILRSFNSVENLKELVKMHLLKSAKQNIRYCEVMITPWFFEKMGFDFFEMMDAMDEGANWVEKRENIQMKLIFDGPRNFGKSVVKEVFEAALKDRTNRVIGVGLGGDEINFPASLFKEEFEFARSHGLNVIAHAGETDGERSMEDAIEVLKAQRLGHGLSIRPNSRLESLICSKNITIEACPLSNIATGCLSEIKQHPLKGYLSRGYQVTLNSDDPALFNTSLNKEFYTAQKVFGLNREALTQLSLNAVNGAFLPRDVKTTMQREVSSFLERYG